MKDKTIHLSGVKLLLLLTLMLFCTANSFAQDSFTFDGINYNITDVNLKTVDVGSFNTTTLSKLTIPKTVKNNDIEYTVTGIATMAFFNCLSLTSIKIPESVTGIAYMAFFNCSSLTSIKIPESVTSIGNLAFCNCSKLTSINIPEGVTSIENACFGQCSSLTSINIPKSVTSIGGSAFANCTSLTSIEIPESVTSIGELAFESCSSLKSIYVNWDTPIDVDYLGVNATLYVPNGKSENYKNHITWGRFNSILEKSFSYNDIYYNITSSKTAEVRTSFNGNLNEVKIPEKVEYNGVKYTVTSIGDYAFFECKSLTSIDIPESVTSIGYSAFSGCSSLTSIVIPESVTSIGEAAFISCSSLTSIDIPESVTSIGEMAFMDCSSSSLTSIKLNWEDDGILEFNLYYIDLNKVTLYVPDGEKANYHEKDWVCNNTQSMLKVTLLVNDETFGKIKGAVNVISGETETYTAIPNTGYHFVKWEGVSNTENPLEIKVDNNFELKAIFAIDQHTITLKGDNGTFSGAGEYEYGKTVKIEAKPNTGYHFVKWEDGNTENPREITVTKDYNLTATFEQHISEPINKPATCTEDGLKDGSKCSVCGVILKEPETIKALGHTYGDPTFIWTDYSKAVASFVCTKDNDTQNIDGVITSDTTLAPTFEKEGLLTYTATFTFNGKPYTDTKKQVLEKLKKGGEDPDGGNGGNNGNNGNGTPVSTVDQQTIKVWGYSETIYLDNTTPDSQIQIFDLTGHLIKSLKTTNSHNEIQLNKKGVFVVVIDNKTSYKVAL